MSNFSTSQARDTIHRDASAATDAVKETVAHAKETIKDGAHQANVKASEAVKSVRTHIAERPLTYVAGGVAAGLLAGLLWRRG